MDVPKCRRTVSLRQTSSGQRSARAGHGRLDEKNEGQRVREIRRQKSLMYLVWLVVEPTHLKNIRQIGSFPQVGVKIKHV